MGAIEVVVRVRPFSSDETETKHAVKKLSEQLVRAGDQTFVFDSVFDSNASQIDMFIECVGKNVCNFIDGYSGAIIAYGQTASGKSYTMTGGSSLDTCGIIPRAVNLVFEQCDSFVKTSFVEIYNEKLLDLFNNRQTVSIRGDGSLKDATTKQFSTAEEMLNFVAKANKLRRTNSTKMNVCSSRSHALLLLELESGAKLLLVDLAGSEAVKKTGASGKLLEEASFINKSLSNLAMVTSALTGGSANTHIPYRGSKLTQMLQGALGGESLTTVIINCSPSPKHLSETLSSLRFGTRAKLVENKGVDESKLDEMAELEQKILATDKILARFYAGERVNTSEIFAVDPVKFAEFTPLGELSPEVSEDDNTELILEVEELEQKRSVLREKFLATRQVAGVPKKAPHHLNEDDVKKLFEDIESFHQRKRKFNDI